MAIGQFVIAILATYRLAHLLPEDEGPGFIFTRIRQWAGTKALMENDEIGKWANLDSGINCVYCCGLYMAALVGLIAIWNNFYGNLFILIFAIAGGQSLLQKVSDRKMGEFFYSFAVRIKRLLGLGDK